MLLSTGTPVASSLPLMASQQWPLISATPVLDDPPPPDDGDPESELQKWSSLIGIVTAISGNVLIALALNVQRYAHIRIHRRRAEARERAKQALKDAANGRGHGGEYGATATNGANGNSSRRNSGHGGGDNDDVEDAHESDPLAQSFQSIDTRSSDGGGEPTKKVSSTYLKDPYWWLGQVLITIGEMGNFLAYGFAPASIVSPLGVVALISNCVIAPILFKEVFRQRDFWGVVIAIAGAVTVVLSAHQKETKLAPHDVWDAITTMEFELYFVVSCVLIVLLMWASPRYGNRTVLIDLGLVGLFGMPCLFTSLAPPPGPHIPSPVDPAVADSLVSHRWIHCPIDQRCLFHAIVDPFQGIYNARHLRPHIHPSQHRGYAGALPQQGSPTFRLYAGHPHTVRPIYTLRHHRQRGAIPRF